LPATVKLNGTFTLDSAAIAVLAAKATAARATDVSASLRSMDRMVLSSLSFCKDFSNPQK
jgi:anti-anti-sigma regulatory factor